MQALFLSSLLLAAAPNSTYTNSTPPSFHPDPSCIFIESWNNTFFCAASSFLSFPGIPVLASTNLRDWDTISHALHRSEQLPALANVTSQTGGIWAATLRFHHDTIYISTTLVFDERNHNDSSRWENVIFSTRNPQDSSSWSEPLHFSYDGYNPSLFWDDNGQTYVVGAHAWAIREGIDIFPIDLATGCGPHIYRKYGYYYLLAAGGGTFLGHMASIARSCSLLRPCESNPANPILANTNTTEYFQAVGHADLFQDKVGNRWSIALAMRVLLETGVAPMSCEAVLYPVTWKRGNGPFWRSGCIEIKSFSYPRRKQRRRAFYGTQKKCFSHESTSVSQCVCAFSLSKNTNSDNTTQITLVLMYYYTGTVTS
ncbi:glycoside hydrolase family 43 protein [Zopfia rhizophila CBS 207.26]|uniref:Glycoside hydrolase family 43 protein n=1 Tax=Zopfia rhizophila CBS 207.26 TaxID=1314779 RepID=A0A6A6EKL5_9PEZI|nr:glycoside hydrolase family 43 protein [Zopfia rhizophila CBS 207.26]